VWDNESYLASLTKLMLWGTLALLLWAGMTWLSRIPMFDLREIRMLGAHHVTEQQVKLVVQQRLQGNFFSTDLDATSAAFIKLPWVREAEIRRVWPNTLVVTLQEHVAVARWNDDALVNSYGEVYRAASDAVLPSLNGPDGSAPEVLQASHEFARILQPLKLNPVKVELNDRRSWSVVLSNGMRLALGREQAQQRLARWVAVYPMTMEQLTVPVADIDLRYPKGFAVHLLASDKQPPVVQAQGKSV
jgi:cell division protein FtsQ